MSKPAEVDLDSLALQTGAGHFKAGDYFAAPLTRA
jgi:hypothetical protein